MSHRCLYLSKKRAVKLQYRSLCIDHCTGGSGFDLVSVIIVPYLCLREMATSSFKLK
ncbi:hypothetical protein BS17DRAFT_779448 [Gyrodon lividus]|nr:hypothetical protein BS17DRAFT_779448 [Gyrodon lividus]